MGEGFVLDKREDGEYEQPTKEDLRTFVGPNPKFLVKDNWAAYGYNNVRYMFEATLNMAQIVGRIPVIPDSAWARTCAVESEICTKHALEYFEHRREHTEMGPKIWNEEGEAWKLGIEHFLDIPHLRRTYGPFLTLSEFFTLYSLPPSLIDYSGTWNSSAYTPEGLSTETFIRDEFEFDIDFVRVDRPLKDSNYYPLPDVEGLNHNVVMETRGWKHVWSMDAARTALGKLGIKLPEDETTLIAAMDKMGQAPLFTFHDDLLMSKALALPVVDLVQRNRIRTLTGQLGGEPFGSASIIYLPGDLHDQRKPGGLRFTSVEGRKGFVDMVLHGIRPPRRYTRLGEELARRMSEKVEGRRWVGAHMRRGDFLGIDWSPDTSARGHLNKTRIALAAGVQVMASREADRLPLPSDPFYLATDEEDPRALAHYRSHGAILLSDLLLPSDRQSLGWQAAFVDLLALVEQEVLANADFFVGSKMSSTTGGIVNMREARRQPGWSWSLLGKEVEAD